MRESWMQVVRLFSSKAQVDVHKGVQIDIHADADSHADSDVQIDADADVQIDAHDSAQGRILLCHVITTTRALRAKIEVALMALLLGVGLVLSIASSRKPGASKSRENGPVLSEKAPELGHPAIVVMNTTSCQIKIALKGKTDRNLLLVPMGAFRTLIAAGRYVMIIQNEEDCRIGVEERATLNLERGRRYFLRLPPRDSD